MKFLRDISIYRKLVFIQMITALCVVLLVTGTFVYVYFQEIKTTKIENLQSISSVIATSCASSLVFSDDQTAREILNDLEGKEDILAAEIKDKEGHTFASYVRNKQNTISTPVKLQQPEFHQFYDDYVVLSRQIRFDNETIGYLIIKASTQDMNQYLIKRINIAGIVAVIGILLAYFLASTLQRYISKPIYKLLNVMNEVKNTATYSVRATSTGKDEIGTLSNVFNEMLDVIEKKDQEAIGHNTSLQEKVKERTRELEEYNEKLKQKNEEIVVAKIQAEQSKAVKELFLANMSHEIRTPLNAIIGFQQLLKQTPLDETQQEYVAAIDFAGKNLLTLVNDILDLSKIESGKLQFEDTEFALREQITKGLDLLRQRAEDKNIELLLHHDDRIPDAVIGDSTRFNQIILNLVGNAIKFTDVGRVELTTQLIRMDANEILCGFEVKDTGIGIPDKQLHRIFESFTQAGVDTTRIYGGTGLGLTICKHLVERFGGSIKVSSKVGVGSVFWFDIHFKRPIEKNTDKKLIVEEAPSYDRKLRILLAEDVMINQRLMQKMAASWGYELTVTSNGHEVLEALKKKDFDVILMDIQMPGMNGLEATRAIRQLEDPAKKDIPIIALTAHASNAEADKCLALGMNAYLTKPFEQKHLFETMHQLVSGHQNIRLAAQNTGADRKRPFISLNTIREHAQGDHEYLIEMLQMYIENMPQYLRELDEHLETEDVDQIYGVVHMMKSPVALFEARDILDHIARIETDYKNNQTGDSWKEEVRLISRQVMQSVELMKKELKAIQAES